MDSSDAAARVVERYEAMELNAVDAREAFREAVEGAEENDLESARDRLVELLWDSEYGTRTTVADLLAVLAEARPSVAAEALPVLESALNNDFPIDERALTAISAVARDQPDAVRDVVELVGTLLDGSQISVQRQAAELLATVSAEHPASVRPIVADLVGVLLAAEPGREETQSWFVDDAPEDSSPVGSAAAREQITAERQRIRASRSEAVADTLQSVAESDPDIVVAHLPALREGFSAGTVTRRDTLRVCVTLAEESPDALASTIPDLTEVLGAVDDSTAHGYALQALATLATAGIEVVPTIVDETEAIVAALSADQPFVRGAAANTLSYVAEVRPRVVEPYVDELNAALDDEHTFVRGGVVWTLGALSTDAAHARLRRLQEHDPDPRIRELAANLRTAK